MSMRKMVGFIAEFCVFQLMPDLVGVVHFFGKLIFTFIQKYLRSDEK